MKKLFLARIANSIGRRSIVAVTILSMLLLSMGTTASLQDGNDSSARKRGTAVTRGGVTTIPLQLAPVSELAPQACTQVLVDGGFETGGIPNTFWNPETSTNFGTPLCDVPSCGTGGGASPPRTGAFWLWFGGIPAAETATLGQTVNLPVGQARLVFWMRVGTVSSPFTDVLNVRVDGAIVQSFPEPAVAEGAYTQRIVNLNAFANGAAHAILFEYIGPTTGTASYVIDDVAVNVCDTPTSAAVPVSGRVVTPHGTGVGRIWVTLLDTFTNETRVTQTRGDGSYAFDEVPAGNFYIISVSGKRYSFSPGSHSLNVVNPVSNVDFVATRE